MRALLVALVVITSGCNSVYEQVRKEENARTEKFRSEYVGRNIHEIVKAFGPPGTVFPNGEVTIYQWIFTGTTYADVNPFGGASAHTQQCKDWFEVDQKDIVVEAHRSGECD